MGTTWLGLVAVSIGLFQAAALQATDGPACVPGFQPDELILNVHTERLKPHRRLGKVTFTDCTDKTHFLFTSSNSRVKVHHDGTLTVKREIALHDGHLKFKVQNLGAQGHKFTLPVKVVNLEHRSHSEHVEHQQPHHQHRRAAEDSVIYKPPVIYFPKPKKGLKRKKRDWVIPDINVSENHRGPYPFKVSQIRSSEDKVKTIYYSITGPGADQSPVGLFYMDRTTGNLFLTQPLDREERDRYMFQAFAVSDGSGDAETPMEIVVNVIDQNDNSPSFEKDTYMGEVEEASPKNFDVIQVRAIDLDQADTDNSDIRYSILSQEPKFPSDNMFVINPITGGIRVNADGLDREKYREYTLVVQASDMIGKGLSGQAKVILTVTDSNDNAPAFVQSSYETAVEENKADIQILTMTVTDGDEPHSPAWNAKFKIVGGDPGGYFTVKTGTNKQEGIISTAKGLDFEKSGKHTLLVAVENEVPFAGLLLTATATVVVNVQDVNEPPIFDPVEKLVSKPEDLAVDSVVVQYAASDPDTARQQKVSYKIVRDPAGWLAVEPDSGIIKVKSKMDRESAFVKEDKYTALIGAYDDDEYPATGTGTLIIQLEDVNDKAPTIEERSFWICNKKPVPQLLSVMDKDGPGFTSPYRVSLQGSSRTNWMARMNDIKTGIILNLKTQLESGVYTVVLRVADNQGLEQVSTLQATVYDCIGEELDCTVHAPPQPELPLILGVLVGILLLLVLVLVVVVVVLLMFVRRQRGEKKNNDIRDRHLDNRLEVFRNDVNLKAADGDPTAPPYDSLLAFDCKGCASES